MSRIFVDIKGFGRQYFRSIIGAFFTFAFPILLIVLFGSIYSGNGSQKVSLPVQNLDGSGFSVAYLNELNNTTLVDIKMIPADANITTYINDNSLSLALQIPADFGSKITSGLGSNYSGPVHVTIYGDQSQSTFGTAAAAVEAASMSFNYNLSRTLPLVAQDVKGLKEGYKFLDYFLPGVVGITVMTNSLFSMSSICAEYRQRGYFRLLATTKLRKHEWLISKFVFFSIILILSLLATFAVASVAFGTHSTITPLALVMIPAGAFLFVSLGMLLGVAIKDPESGVAVANAIGFPMMFLSGSFFPLDMMPKILQDIATALPLTYFNNGLRDTMVYGNTGGCIVNLLVVVVVGLVFFVLASRLMSWKER
jgi:ABC-2 type transport system permease protein